MSMRKLAPAQTLLLVALSGLLSWNASSALGQGKKGGGGGTTTLTNPAFVYHDTGDGGLFLTNAGGTANKRLTSNTVGHDLAPAWSPDLDPDTAGYQGKIAFFRQPDPSYIWGDIMLIPASGSGSATVLRSYVDFDVPPPDLQNGETVLCWSPDGSRIVYASEGRIWAVTVATGQALMIFDKGFHPVYAGCSQPSLSPDQDPDLPGYQGQLVFTLGGNAPAGGGNGSDIGVTDIDIDANGLLTMAGTWTLVTNSTDWAESHAVWSPDGLRLAMFVKPGGNPEPLGAGRQLAVREMLSGVELSVVSTYMDAVRPTWSPDGLYIGFSDARKVAGKWTTDVFFVDRLGLETPFNVTRTDSGRATEKNPHWSPAWVNDLP